MKKKNKTELSIVIFIIIMLLGAVVYQNRGFLRHSLNQTKSVFNYESTAQYSFDTLEGNILALSSEGLTSVSESGRKQWNIIHQITNPRMSVCGNYIVVFDNGGREIKAYLRNVKLWEYATTYPIKTAKINGGGYVAVVSQETGYNDKVEIIGNSGELIYKWLLSENYIIDIDLSPDSKHLAAAVLRPDSAEVTCGVVIVDINGERVKGEAKFCGNLIFSLKYQKNSSIIALGGDGLCSVSQKGEKEWFVDFEGKQLEGFKLGFNTGNVLVFAADQNESIVQIIGKKGKKTGEYISEEKIKDVDIFENMITAVQSRSLTVLNQSGRPLLKAPLEKDIKKAVILSKHRIAAIGNNNIEIIKP